MTSKEEIQEFMSREFPQDKIVIVTAGSMTATIRHEIQKRDIRPGGTVSGPTLMELADAALYIAIHATIGLTPHAVTSNLNINFLKRPSADHAIIATCNLLKIGRTLIVGEISLYSEGAEDPVAHVVGTYSLPQDK